MRVAWLCVAALAVGAWGWMAAGCGIEFVDGCRSHDECRYGRVCREGFCAWPDGWTPGDAGADADVDIDATDATADPSADPGLDGAVDAPRDVATDTGSARLVVVPNPVDFGAVGAGESRAITVVISNTGGASATIVRLRLESDSVFSLPEELASTRLAPGETVSSLLAATMPLDAAPGTTFRGRLRVEAGDASPDAVDVRASVARVEECPATLQLSADRDGPSTTDDTLVFPMGHQARAVLLTEGVIHTVEVRVTPAGGRLLTRQAPGTGAWLLVPERPGLYALAFHVRGRDGCEVVLERRLVVEAPEAGLVLWLTWDAPAGGGGLPMVADLDLYLARRTSVGYLWQTAGEVCGPSFPTADFGTLGVDVDDAVFAFDYNTQGFGPEQIAIQSPAFNETLAIGAHAFDVPRGRAVSAWIVVYRDGRLLAEAALEAALSRNDFWLFAELTDGQLLTAHNLVVTGFPEPSLP
jgi:hypothetical protein